MENTNLSSLQKNNEHLESVDLENDPNTTEPNKIVKNSSDDGEVKQTKILDGKSNDENY